MTATPITSPTGGRLVDYAAAEGAQLAAGAAVAIIEVMKMEQLVAAPVAGVLIGPLLPVDTIVGSGEVLAWIEPGSAATPAKFAAGDADPQHIRPDLAAARARIDATLDGAREEAVGRRRAAGRLTAREALGAVFDPGSANEYGGLALPMQRSRHTPEGLRALAADGVVTALGSVEGRPAAGIAYDFTVLAGTQGFQGHRKLDRVFELIARERLPTVLWAEGGGGRPGDVDAPGVAGLDVPSFRAWAALSGVAPRVAIVSGYCFAGNAALAGCADLIVATRASWLGMGGPAMIEGGGLGVVAPTDIGPSEVQSANGVIDLLVEDDREAVTAARRLLASLGPSAPPGTHADPRDLRALVPENRARTYDIRAVVETLFDTGSVIELRRGFGNAALTALARLAGRPVALIANDSVHLGGAIDAPACRKLAAFLRLADRFRLPVVSLCDTPGFMVGPACEATGQVRAAGDLFTAAARITVPVFAVVLRKGYGLGAQAMTGGGFHAPHFLVSWPTGEFGGMGLEGAVKLGFRKEIEAQPDEASRRAYEAAALARLRAAGSAVSMAEHFEIDAVIDPADTRDWLVRGLAQTARRPTDVRE